jgi:DNA repair protein RecN (Recombination protein N)
MLKKLRISNYALIEEVKVSFPMNLAIVTGETGAGKSIFLEALSLVLGARADVGALQDKGRKCIVEAEFFLGNYNLEEFFKNNQLDFETNTILRREINPEGKSRAFINDSPVVLNVMKQLGERLVDVHSQHETLMLNESSFQFDVIDSVAGTQSLAGQYKKQFQLLKQKERSLSELEEKERQAKKDLDYYQFLFNELEEITIKPGDLKGLEEESSALENAEFIKSNLLRSAGAIQEGDTNLLSGISQIKQQLNQLVKFGETYKTLSERANSLYIELKELANDLEDAENKIVFDPKKLEEINSKLDKLNRLFKKHNAKSEEELITIKQEIEQKLQQFGSLETEIAKISREILSIKKDVNTLAADISKKRRLASPAFEKEIHSILNDLSMPNANFKIELDTLPEPGPHGTDNIQFLFSANKGSDFKALHKVASGGELSRLMLSIKSIMASKKALPTIIFDEIDTGVSGDVADKIGQILLRMSDKMQVISITHLPQIASKGKFHLFVYKNDDKKKTISHIKELDKDERVVEIAKMLSTGNPSASAIKNAKDLLSQN